MDRTERDRRAEVLAAEERWAAAHRRLDLETLDALMAEDYVRVNPDGTLSPKREVVAWYGAHDRTWEVGEADQIEVRLLADAAVVIGRWRGRGGSDLGSFDYAARYVSVWVDRSGHWQMVTEQSTPIEGERST